MAGPKGTRRVALAGGRIHVFSTSDRVILQVRVEGDDGEPTQPWVKAGVALDLREAMAVAGELLRGAAGLAAKVETKKNHLG